MKINIIVFCIVVATLTLLIINYPKINKILYHTSRCEVIEDITFPYEVDNKKYNLGHMNVIECANKEYIIYSEELFLKKGHVIIIE